MSGTLPVGASVAEAINVMIAEDPPLGDFLYSVAIAHRNAVRARMAPYMPVIQAMQQVQTGQGALPAIPAPSPATPPARRSTSVDDPPLRRGGERQIPYRQRRNTNLLLNQVLAAILNNKGPSTMTTIRKVLTDVRAASIELALTKLRESGRIYEAEPGYFQPHERAALDHLQPAGAPPPAPPETPPQSGLFPNGQNQE
jgi:hypothetical protein